MMDPQALLKVLTDARLGDSVKVHFKPGQGKKGTLTQDERVSFLRFLALVGLPEGEKHLTPEGFTELVSMELLVVGQSGYWDLCGRQRSFTVTHEISAEDARFYASRIGPVLEEFTLVPASTA